ncbi:uncharacterized protein LOC132799717 [Ziziphus jujuba]|uniref:Uncharacterized protein LOC132799717 n=1 Tax=Ziziphus jujuba TaxID=326968 RepID=A0ABM3ZUK4_ZIZJJ|nr:uncharacterized protein LOC132799717 [Ziziphus jujuba]
MEDLPKELVIPTPLHLPVEDLVRCKSVCKALYSIITSRPFIDVGQKIRNSYTLVKYEEDPFNRHHAISLLSDETLEIIDTQPVLSHTPLLDSMLTRYRDYVIVVGCCNGVVCLRCIPPHDEYVLWNPATREAKIIPDGLYKSNPDKNMFRHQNMGYGGEMFSGLVWNEKYGEHVISFDISDEVFVTTPLPLACIIESHDCRNRLMFHNKSLALDHCVKDRNNDTETHNIWVLGEYGVKESWTNLFNAGLFEPRTKSISGFWNNNKVLLQVNGGGCRHHLILVDPSNRKIKDLDIHWTLMQLFHYQESLVQIIATPPINLF